MRATSRAFLRAGISIAINNAMIAITTRSSINVKPLASSVTILRILDSAFDFMVGAPTRHVVNNAKIRALLQPDILH
jgi:hypothetical protein